MPKVAVGILLVALGAVGCVAQDSSHPPPLDCSGDNCRSDTVVTNTGNGGASNGSGGESSTAGVAGEVTVTGHIVEVDEPAFSVSAASPASGSFTVVVPGANSKDLSQKVSADFSIGGVKWSETLWLSASPGTSTDLLTGLIALDTTRNTTTLIPVVRRSTLELVAAVLTSPLTLNTTDGQVVLRFVDKNNEPVTGIKVAVSGAKNVAYDVGASYTDDSLKGTGNRGLAFLLNVDAGATPAAKYVTLSGAVTADFAVWVQSGAATALELLVSKN